ncbi:MAG: TIGR03618 family F420-dependent PPOX class oxidoreductase [Anaerolineales bacterium]|nr:MAG: TIGR03618 family F420-dependent PPOX class oxidoreductase [Anaerolineales bacterium]
MTMTPAEIETFLKAPRHAVVGTNPVDGPPQLSPVWYVYEGGRLYISVGVDTAKHRNLRRDSRVSVCIDGCYPDFRTVMIYGTAELIDSGTPLQEEMRWRIIRQYHESEAEARRYAESTREERSVLIVVTPHKIISQDFS